MCHIAWLKAKAAERKADGWEILELCEAKVLEDRMEEFKRKPESLRRFQGKLLKRCCGCCVVNPEQPLRCSWAWQEAEDQQRLLSKRQEVREEAEWAEFEAEWYSARQDFGSLGSPHVCHSQLESLLDSSIGYHSQLESLLDPPHVSHSPRASLLEPCIRYHVRVFCWGN